MSEKFNIEKNGNLDENTINSLKNSSAQNLISKLSEEDKKKLMSTLSDKEALEKILSTPQAKRLLELFKGGKK